MSETKQRKVRLPNFIEALLPILVMMGLMIYGLNFSNEVYYDAHMPLVVSIVVACIIGALCGHSFSDMLAGMIERLNATMEAILILCTVGLLVASFIMSGTIPALIYYGLDLLTPKLFLPVGCILCSIVGLACGSSWTATATIGIAMLGIGAGLGINPAITAGMIISGAYVGDKFSPLSDTTNLAAAVSKTGLFDHVTAMVSTTAPTFVIALILYTILGFVTGSGNYDPTVATDLQAALFCDATMCDQFLGIGVPAPLYEDKYDEMGLSRNMLSRTLEDCGTLWAVMFPWTGCGAYQMGVLGISPFQYFPFAFVNLLNPIYAAITAYMGRNIFWADGAYTNILGKTTMHKPAGAPEEAHARALKNLEALRAASKAPIPTGKAAAKV